MDLGRPPLVVALTNLYDAALARGGSLSEGGVRSVGIRGAVIDPNVLSVGIPKVVADMLGLTTEEPGSRRLTPIEVVIRERRCGIDPFLTEGDQVVVGHVAPTALGLKYDPEWGLMDDPYPAR